MEELKLMKSAYSYYWPEVRAVIDEVVADYPHEVFLRSIGVGLDDFDKPIIEKLIQYRKKAVPALSDFQFRYSTNGAEEAIRETLTWLAAQGVTEIYVLAGDYEGYEAVAKTRRIKTRFVEEDELANLEPGYFYISNPSGRDGNIIPDEFINKILDYGHKVFYDLSYLGLTQPHVFDVSHPNILGVFISFSKPFGMFYYRQGFAFTRMEIPALYGNKWFKNILSLIIADRIMDRIGPEDLYKKYHLMQKEVIEKLRVEVPLNLNPSDVMILSYLSKEEAEKLQTEQKEAIKKYQRAQKFRFCLTPYFTSIEQESIVKED